jgi:hypothetical protein
MSFSLFLSVLSLSISLFSVSLFFSFLSLPPSLHRSLYISPFILISKQSSRPRCGHHGADGIGKDQLAQRVGRQDTPQRWSSLERLDPDQWTKQVGRKKTNLYWEDPTLSFPFHRASSPFHGSKQSGFLNNLIPRCWFTNLFHGGLD